MGPCRVCSPEVPLSTPKGDADPRPMQRKRDEAMKTSHINQHRSRIPNSLL
ncbi:MAG: hypothetical protein QXV81_08810 [Ignisphaera sp.]